MVGRILAVMATRMQRNELTISGHLAQNVFGVQRMIALTGSTIMTPVVDENDHGRDVGVLIPHYWGPRDELGGFPILVRQRYLFVRVDPKHEGYYRIRILNAKYEVIDTLSRVPERDVYQTCLEAVHAGEMGAF